MSDDRAAEEEHGVKDADGAGDEEAGDEHYARAEQGDEDVAGDGERFAFDPAARFFRPFIDQTDERSLGDEGEKEYYLHAYGHLNILPRSGFLARAYVSESTRPSNVRSPSAAENECMRSPSPLTVSGPSLVVISMAAGEELITFSTPVISVRERDSTVSECLIFTFDMFPSTLE